MGSPVDVNVWREHWQDEGESALLYRVLAELDSDERRRRLYLRLAEVETQHQETFERLLGAQGITVGPFRPSLRARFLAWLARRGGAPVVLALRIADEAREVKSYLRESRTHGPAETRAISERVARDEASHAMLLAEMAGRRGEPWHRTASGGYLRNVVYGFNDGLTANFGLIMGVIGAEVSEKIVLISGIAGLIADALSMGSSGYLAAKSEQEVYTHEVAMEREEIRLMPEVEKEELALLYELKGMTPEEARQAAERVMADPEVALTEKTREELGIIPQAVTPLREGVITGIATGFGAFIPIIPFLVASGRAAVWTSIVISMLSHFGVGAARSFFTGRGIIRSGMDMFLVGLGVAIVGYFVGWLLTGHF